MVRINASNKMKKNIVHIIICMILYIDAYKHRQNKNTYYIGNQNNKRFSTFTLMKNYYNVRLGYYVYNIMVF